MHGGFKNKTLCASGDPTETEPDLPLTVWVSPEEVRVGGGLPQGEVFWVWHKPSWRRLPLTLPQSCQNLHRIGETDSWRAQTKPCANQDPGERSSDHTRDWPRLACECPGVSSGVTGQRWPAAGLGALSVSVHAWDLFEEVAIIFIHSVQSLSHIRLFVTPWTAAQQASLSTTNSQSLLKLMSMELVMPCNHFILCRPLPPSIFPSIRVFSNESVLCIRWPKYWSFNFSVSPSNEYSGLILHVGKA